MVQDGSRSIVDSFQPEGRGFNSRSSRHIGTLGKSLTRGCLWRFGMKLRHSIRAVSGATLISILELRRRYRNSLNELMNLFCRHFKRDHTFLQATYTIRYLSCPRNLELKACGLVTSSFVCLHVFRLSKEIEASTGIMKSIKMGLCK